MIDKRKEEIQKQAVETCEKSIIDGKLRGTCEIATGTGKTFIAFWLIHKSGCKEVLFLAETKVRWQNILDDMEKFREFYGIDLTKKKLQFACYQSAYKWKDRTFDFVVADEIHDSLTPKYFEFYLNNTYNHLLGLSATIEKRKYKNDLGEEYNKIGLLNQVAPVVFQYTLQEGIENKTSRKLNVIVIEHHLDRVNKTLPVTYKDKKTGESKTFYQTEQDMYEYYNDKFYRQIYSRERNDFLIRFFANKRARVLYDAPSKMDIVKYLLKFLNRTIIFGNDIDSLISVVPTVCSRNDAKANSKIINDFNDGKLNVIGSFKMLKQGINLKNLDNVIMHSYYGIPKDSIQRVGRLRQSVRDGFVFIILTRGTQEEVWFNRMIEPIANELIYTNNAQEAIQKWLELLNISRESLS